MPGPLNIELDISANDNLVTARWKANDRPQGKVIINDADLKLCVDTIRTHLGQLNNYIKDNPQLDRQFDPNFERYNRLLRTLSSAGYDLYALLVADNFSLRQLLDNAAVGTPLTVFVDDQNVTVPLGFAQDGRVWASTDEPSIADFAAFWLNKFSITTWISSGESAVEPITVNSDSFNALYAVDTGEWQKASPTLFDQFPELVPTFRIDVGIHKTWETTIEAWRSIVASDNVLFFFTHSDGTSLTLDGEIKQSFSLKNLFAKKDTSPKTILLVNACMSLAGNRQGASSILSLAAQAGFAGLIGTEAEILNSWALICGASIIHSLCFENLSLGCAFDKMRADKRLFPLNLFYSCYGDRSFSLNTPIQPTR